MGKNKVDESAQPLLAQSRRARPRSKTVTLQNLADIVGVTKVTISRALSAPHLVAAETLERVQAAVQKTGYIPNLVAGSLATNRSRLVVAVIPTVAGSVFQETTEAMTATLRRKGYQLLIGQSGYDESNEEALIEEILGRRPAGLVLTGVMHSPKVKKLLLSVDIPVIETWDLTPEPIDMLVGFAHDEVGIAAANHLYARGARHAAIITPDDRRALTRARAFADEIGRSTGTKHVPIRTLPAPTSMGDGRRALRDLLSAEPCIDAVFCAADSLALGALIEARAQGLAVPSDMRVLGYGDLVFAKDADPPLSTVRIDGTRIGELAASMLIARIEGKIVQQNVVDIGFDLIERAST